MEYNSPRNNFAKQIDIVDLVSKTVKLEKRGNNYFGCCPFHGEDTPSLSVNNEKHIYKCFGCGKGGDAIQFVIESQGCTFNQAVTYLANLYNINPQHYGITLFQRNPELDQIISVNDEAAKFYHWNLTMGQEGEYARQYLKARHIEAEDIAEFNLGFALNDRTYLQKILNEKQFNQVAIDDSQLVINGERSHDFFINRVMFPIANVNGETVGFSGRSLVTDPAIPKYLNSRETKAFDKSVTLYNLNKSLPFIKEKREVIIFEGFMDLIRAWQTGTKNTVAIMGTALTDSHIKLLSKYADKIILAFDGDKAGVNATLKNIEILSHRFPRLFAVKFPGTMDPDEFILKFGYEEFHKKIKNAPSFVEYYVAAKVKSVNLTSPFEKNDFAKEVGGLISRIRDEAIEKDLVNLIKQKYDFSPELPKSERGYQNNWNNRYGKNVEPVNIIKPKTKSEVEYIRDIGYDQKFTLAMFNHECLLLKRIIQRPQILLSHERLKVVPTLISSEDGATLFSFIKNKVKLNANINSDDLIYAIRNNETVYSFYVFLNEKYSLPEYFDDKEITFYLEMTIEVKKILDQINYLEHEKAKYNKDTNSGLNELLKINAQINELHKIMRSKH